MAVVRKTGLLQVRCRPEDLEAFEAACKLDGIKPTERIRRFLVEEAGRIQRKVAARDAWQATKEARAAAVVAVEVPASPPVQKPPVGPIRQPQSLSERRKAEKLAKQAKMAKREGRYLEE